jgi:hypothetical protein
MSEAQWYYAKSGTRLGPISEEELKNHANCGELSRSDLVWSTESDEWKPASTVPGLFNRVPPPLPSDNGKTRLDGQVTDKSPPSHFQLNCARSRGAADLNVEISDGTIRCYFKFPYISDYEYTMSLKNLVSFRSVDLTKFFKSNVSLLNRTFNPLFDLTILGQIAWGAVKRVEFRCLELNCQGRTEYIPFLILDEEHKVQEILRNEIGKA